MVGDQESLSDRVQKSGMSAEKPGTLEGKEQEKRPDAELAMDVVKLKEVNKKLQAQLKTAMDRVGMLERGLETKTTTVQVSRTENGDSITIGAPSQGQVKVYGDFTRKTEFAARIKDALELLAAARESVGNGDAKKGSP